jgi:hypothetical protein
MMLTFVPAMTVTASGEHETAGSGRGECHWCHGIFMLSVIATGGGGDKIDCYLQSSLNGVDWSDFIHFPTVKGGDGTKKFLAAWADSGASAEPHEMCNGTMAVKVCNEPQPGQWRLKWVVAGTTGRFVVELIGDVSHKAK